MTDKNHIATYGYARPHRTRQHYLRLFKVQHTELATMYNEEVANQAFKHLAEEMERIIKDAFAQTPPD